MKTPSRYRRRSLTHHSVLLRLEQGLSFAKAPRVADASVLIALTDEAEPRVLLTRRAKTLKSHAGEVSFPGGKRDPADTSNIAVALREAQEETGLDPFAVRLLGELPSQRSRSGLWVKPIIGVIPANTDLIAQPDEIDRLFYVRVSEFLYRRPTPYAVTFNGQRLYVPSYHVEDEVVWGLTARMLIDMFRRGLGHRLDWPLLMKNPRRG